MSDQIVTARAAGLVACTRCSRVHPPGVPRCDRCGARLSSRNPHGLQRVWAWWWAGLIAYIPANLYPMLLTNTFGSHSESTILGGVIELWAHGDAPIALIVFAASIVIPVGKFLAIGFLAMSLRTRQVMSEHAQHRLFAVVEFIGRWSMIDVFVVAILASLVQFNIVASINPGLAAICFAVSVAFTMQAALSFDPRTIWDD
ncbi:paraquat-inducible protein A [Falsirhodobacter algicola]|uniref:Paraquat-inducible membrane protein A n=1 Tax=Falsirhodobacter algicola TaxID=2692330 RepID=A0A8J8SJY6_9RHOB|nr:paraquat-inducible protein A [Falsirhodobacter algicola]QUS35320.1 paraquat-inducible membrane protein A [Falsirhodobacter algicola]